MQCLQLINFVINKNAIINSSSLLVLESDRTFPCDIVLGNIVLLALEHVIDV